MKYWLRTHARTRDELIVEALDTSHLSSQLGLRTVRGALITASSSVILMTVQILQLSLLSRLLHPEAFGLVGMALVVTSFVRLFSDFGLSTATVQRDEIDQNFVSALFYIDLSASMILMLLCWLAAPAAAEIYSEPRVAPLIVILAVAFPITALRGQHRALLARRMLYFRLNLATVAAALIGLLVAVFCAALLNLGYWSIVAGTIAGSLGEMALFWLVSSWRPGPVSSWATARSAIGFGLNLLGANLAGWMWKQSDNALIGYRWNAAELGFYTRAYSVFSVPLTLISGPIGGAVIPALSRLQHKEDEWCSLLSRTARIMAFFAGLMSMELALNADLIIHILLGPEWNQSIAIFYFLSISIFPSFVWELSRFIFLSLGRTKIMMHYAIAAGLIHVAAFVIGVQFGAKGVAVSLAVISWLVVAPLLMVCSHVSRLSVRALASQFLPSLVAMVVTWSAAYVIQEKFPIGETLFKAVLMSTCISGLYAAGHLLLCPFHQGWRRDIVSVVGKIYSKAGYRFPADGAR